MYHSLIHLSIHSVKVLECLLSARLAMGLPCWSSQSGLGVGGVIGVGADRSTGACRHR